MLLRQNPASNCQHQKITNNKKVPLQRKDKLKSFILLPMHDPIKAPTNCAKIYNFNCLFLCRKFSDVEMAGFK